MSPPSRRRLHRQATNTTPSSSSSRTESPRFTKEQESQYGVIKMKKSSARLNPNRNSASLQTSTLQEDLIKLIGKDFEHAGKTINSKLKVSYFFIAFWIKILISWRRLIFRAEFCWNPCCHLWKNTTANDSHLVFFNSSVQNLQIGFFKNLTTFRLKKQMASVIVIFAMLKMCYIFCYSALI